MVFLENISWTYRIILFVVYFNDVIYGCGTSTHISIAHQASLSFKSPSNLNVDYTALIRRHQDAFVAGNPYPDAMYPSICFGGHYHQVAEDTHWVPFLNASINYIRRTYPQPWDQETEKLVAFVFGFVSHQIADVTWHSLGINQGFIRAMAASNFLNVYDTAHTDADVGGDMLTQFDHDDKPVGIFKWYVPVDDLYQIYKEYYHGNQTVPKIVIETCSTFLFIEYFAETYGGAKIFKPFVKKSPFLYNHLHDYFLGGINDMASWTNLIWNQTAYMFEHGTESCHLNHSALLINCQNFSSRNINLQTPTTKNPGRAYPLLTGGWKITDVSAFRSSRGLYLQPSDAMYAYMKEYRKKAEVNMHGNLLDDKESSPKHLFSINAYANAGRSLTSIRIGNETKLAIGAPNYWKPGLSQLGCVYIVSITTDMKTSLLDENLDDIQILEGAEEMGKFGWAMSSILYNNDEFQDLVISAPVTGANKLEYFGKVYIYFGSANGLSQQPDIILNYEDEAEYTNFGFFLKTCQSELMISTPFNSWQKGFVRTLSNGKNGISKLDYFGATNYSWFGYSLECVHQNNDSVLFVGSPNYRKCFWHDCKYDFRDLQSIGKVDVFLNGKFFLDLEGDTFGDIFGEFGTSITYGDPFGNQDYVLAVGAPSKDVEGRVFGEIPYELKQAGEVILFNVTSLLKYPYRSHGHILAKYQGDRAYGRFGELVKFHDINSDGHDELIIASPRRSEDFTEELYGGEEGAVYIFDSSTMNGIATDNCPLFKSKPCPDLNALKTFLGSEANAHFGTSIEVISNNGYGKQLIVSSPQSSVKSYHGGSIHIYNL